MPAHVAEDLCQMPQILTSESAFRRVAHPEAITNLLVADIGMAGHSLPHLIIHSELGDVEVYEPFHTDGQDLNTLRPESLRWIKSPCAIAGDYDDIDEENAIQKRCEFTVLSNVQGYNTVFVSSSKPTLLIREPSTTLKAIELADTSIETLCRFHHAGHAHTLLVTDNLGSVHAARLPENTTYGTVGWPLKQIPLKEQVESVVFHIPSGLYVAARTTADPMSSDLFEYCSASNISSRPRVLQSTLNLIHPDTWEAVSSAKLHNYGEDIVCLKAVSLEASQEDKQRRSYIIAGTAVARGEDLPCLGGLYVFDVIEVSPDTTHPHPHTTKHKIHLVAHEEFRGPVTALCEAGNHGLVMIAQGQKLLVRGLRQDIPGQLFPVAFMDMATYVTSLKTLKGTSLALIGDALKGVSLAGFEVGSPATLSSLLLLTRPGNPLPSPLPCQIPHPSRGLHCRLSPPRQNPLSPGRYPRRHDPPPRIRPRQPEIPHWSAPPHQVHNPHRTHPPCVPLTPVSDVPVPSATTVIANERPTRRRRGRDP